MYSFDKTQLEQVSLIRVLPGISKKMSWNSILLFYQQYKKWASLKIPNMDTQAVLEC